MTTLSEILKNLSDLPKWAYEPFTGFCLDSRQIKADNIFIALQGVNNDIAKTHEYIAQALNQNALAILTEIKEISDTDHILYVPNLRYLLGQLQQKFLQVQQQQQLARVVAVTGTNGKTTVSRLVAELLTLLDEPTAVMGTTGNGILPKLEPSTHTTLDALQLQQAYYQYSQQGAKFLALEASSHGLEQGRLSGTPIEVAAYTNLSRDHLDYHQTLDNYAQAKAALFDFPTLKYAVINADDDYAELMIAHVHENLAQPQLLTYTISGDSADYHIEDLQFSLSGAGFVLNSPSGQYVVRSSLLGHFNVENVLAAMISVEKLGFDLSQIIPLIPELKGAPGRMQVIADQSKGNESKQDQSRLFIVDYAHTPDALEQVLRSLSHHVEHQLWAVFGCGGDRDRGKRPLMTQAALNHADHVLLTSDNPRTENPEQIFSDMKNGVDLSQSNVLEIHDRREAIKYAIQHAKAGDIVVIAGKGHENYQEIDGVRHWFDDVVEIQSALSNQNVVIPQNYSAH